MSLGQTNMLLTWVFTCACGNSVPYLLRCLILLVLGVWKLFGCTEKYGFLWAHSLPTIYCIIFKYSVTLFKERDAVFHL